MLADASVSVIVVEHRDRLGRLNVELVEAALSASVAVCSWRAKGRGATTSWRDMVEVLTSFCARLYGRRSAARRAEAAAQAGAAAPSAAEGAA